MSIGAISDIVLRSLYYLRHCIVCEDFVIFADGYLQKTNIENYNMFDLEQMIVILNFTHNTNNEKVL